MCRLGSDLSFNDAIKFASASTYIRHSSGNIEAYVNTNRAMSLTSTGGVLHGTWTADTVIMTSDRRKKENIQPLVGALKQNYKKVPFTLAAASSSAPRFASAEADKVEAVEGGGSNALHWVLRQLRPVSYNFRKGTDSKNVRFGFVADEMQKVLPQVVRSLSAAESKESQPQPVEEEAGSGNRTNENNESSHDADSEIKGIVYPDLIAVLTSIVKDFGAQVQGIQNRMRVAELELDRLDREDPL